MKVGAFSRKFMASDYSNLETAKLAAIAFRKGAERLRNELQIHKGKDTNPPFSPVYVWVVAVIEDLFLPLAQIYMETCLKNGTVCARGA